MAVEITETPRHTLTVSEQNWNLTLASGSVSLPDDATFDNVTVSQLLTANHIHGNLAGSVYVHVFVREDVSKGDPVYITGFNVGHGEPEVHKAQANDNAKMPAVGVMANDYTANTHGADMVISGVIEDVNTNGFGVNTPIYVGPTGGFTATKPSTNPQQVGICDRDNQNNGSFVVTAKAVSPNQDLNTDSDVDFQNVGVTTPTSGNVVGVSVINYSNHGNSIGIDSGKSSAGIAIRGSAGSGQSTAAKFVNSHSLNSGKTVVISRSNDLADSLEVTGRTSLIGDLEIKGGGTDNERLTLSCDSAGDATIDVQSDTGGSGSGDLTVNSAVLNLKPDALKFPTATIYSHLFKFGVGYLRNDGSINAKSFAIETSGGCYITTSYVKMRSAAVFGWSNGNPISTGADTGVSRLAANHVAIGNGTTGDTSGALSLSKINLTPTSSAPASPSAGDLYFDSTTSKLRCYDGTAWNDCF